jgi:hypothetical protein
MKPFGPFKYLFITLVFLLVSFGSFAQASEVNSVAGIDKAKFVQVYPNPADEFVNIKFENTKVSEVKLTLHNLIGNEVNVESEKVDDHHVRLRVKDLASGYYLVAVRDKDFKFRATYKFLKR